MSLTIILIVVSCGIGFLLLGKLATQPGRAVKRILLNSILGICLLWLINSLGSVFGLGIPLNTFTVLVTGVLGLPGIAMLGLLQWIVK